MIVPFVAGPGPLEGGPKSSPGSVKEDENFSSTLKTECDRSIPDGEIDAVPKDSSASLVNSREISLSSPTDVPQGEGEATEEMESLLPIDTDELLVGDVKEGLIPTLILPNAGQWLAGVEDREEDLTPPQPELESEDETGKANSFGKGEIVSGSVPLGLFPPALLQESSAVVGSPVRPSSVVESVSSLPLKALQGGGRAEDVNVVLEGESHKAAQLNPPEVSVSKQEAPVPVTDKPLAELNTKTTLHSDFPTSSTVLTPSMREDGFNEFQQDSDSNARQESPAATSITPIFPTAAETTAFDGLAEGLTSLEKSVTSMIATQGVTHRTGGAIPLMGGPGLTFPEIEVSKTVAGVPTPPPAPPEFKPSPLELARQIHVHLESGRSVVRMDLQPEQLGELHIALEAKGKDVSMQFRVENDSARQAVASGLRELSGTLSTLGWSVNGLSVSVSSGGVGTGRGDGGNSGWAPSSSPSNILEDESGTSHVEKAPGGWRVDLVA
jgi:hypothetical protein